MNLKKVIYLSLTIVLINGFNSCVADKIKQPTAPNSQQATQLSVPFLDLERIMKESLVMIYIEKKKDEERTKLEKKAEEFENKLRNIQEKIKAAQMDDKTTEADLNKMQQNFDEEESNFHNKLTALYKNSEKVFNKAEDDVLDVVMDVSSKVAESKNYKLVLNKSIVLIGDKSLDMTQDVLDELNKRIKLINIKL